MSSAASSKVHGCTTFNADRPKSSPSKRANKAKARDRKMMAVAKWQEMLKG